MDSRSRLTRIHLEHTGEGFFGMLERAVSIVQDTNAIPQFRLLLPISTCSTSKNLDFTYLRVG